MTPPRALAPRDGPAVGRALAIRATNASTLASGRPTFRRRRPRREAHLDVAAVNASPASHGRSPSAASTKPNIVSICGPRKAQSTCPAIAATSGGPARAPSCAPIGRSASRAAAASRSPRRSASTRGSGARASRARARAGRRRGARRAPRGSRRTRRPDRRRRRRAPCRGVDSRALNPAQRAAVHSCAPHDKGRRAPRAARARAASATRSSGGRRSRAHPRAPGRARQASPARRRAGRDAAWPAPCDGRASMRPFKALSPSRMASRLFVAWLRRLPAWAAGHARVAAAIGVALLGVGALAAGSACGTGHAEGRLAAGDGGEPTLVVEQEPEGDAGIDDEGDGGAARHEGLFARGEDAGAEEPRGLPIVAESLAVTLTDGYARTELSRTYLNDSSARLEGTFALQAGDGQRDALRLLPLGAEGRRRDLREGEGREDLRRHDRARRSGLGRRPAKARSPSACSPSSRTRRSASTSRWSVSSGAASAWSAAPPREPGEGGARRRRRSPRIGGASAA